MSKTRCLIHIVFATKRREMTIPEAHKRRLYAYMMGIIENKHCKLLRINGIGNHLHILVDLHPTIALASLVQAIKQWSTHWMKGEPDFRLFHGWGDGYYAASVSANDFERVKRYIINQETHHGLCRLDDELQTFAGDNDLTWYQDDLQ